MIYSVVVEPSAKADIRSIVTYIRSEFGYEQYAASLFEALYRAIASLKQNPRRYQKYEEGIYVKRDVHKMPVRKYNVYYTVDDTKKNVTILRVFYSGRNQELVND